jgi:hypothetical protein
MKADDYGCFWADPKRLKANLFPLKSDSIREADILRWMAECQKAGLIVIYESDEKKYLQIIEFGQRLRVKKSKFPKPDRTLRSDDGEVLPDDGLNKKEVEVEVEEKPPRIYWDGERLKKHSLEHCLEIALKDAGFVKANKTSKRELEIFNDFLRKTGESEKDFIDYKKHFGNKKIKNPELFKQNATTNYTKTIAAIESGN